MTPLVAYLLLFVAVGAGFILVHLLAGKLIRPNKPGAEKQTIYECGEPTIGSAWIQFDLRFYVVALLFVIFDVEVAFFFPWAEVFGKSNAIAAEHKMPADFESMKAYSARVVELTPAGQSNELFKIVASMDAKQYAEFQKLAAGSGSFKDVKTASATALKGMASGGPERRPHEAVLALPDAPQLQALRERSVPLTQRDFEDTRKNADALAWTAMLEIVVFFGVLLVGFAYLWKRGDLAWVRSLQAERQMATPVTTPLLRPQAAPPAMAGADHH